MAASPARMLVVMSRKTKQTTRMSPVYANSTGGVLKARMYAMPTTVPGTAKFSIAMNSNARLPAKR